MIEAKAYRAFTTLIRSNLGDIEVPQILDIRRYSLEGESSVKRG
jgi:hypothetical protein